MSLLLPFALQWSLGGFESSSAVCLWAFTSPLGALLFVGRAPGGAVVRRVRRPGRRLGRDRPGPGRPARPTSRSGVVVAFFALNILGVATTAYVLLQYFVRARERR